jgi:tripartite-type tricarboxylate transporter receptor subunit TctC
MAVCDSSSGAASGCRRRLGWHAIARLALTALTTAAVSPLAAGTSAAQEEVAFYKHKTIRVVVGFSAGGGYDIYARLVARHLGRHIPGSPLLIVENMPGAGSLKAVQSLAAGGADDGTTLATFNSGLITQSLTSPTRVPVDFRRFAWIGNAGEDVRICYMWGSTGIRSFDDLIARNIVYFGATSPGTAGYTESVMLRDLLGVKLHLVQGYPGSNDKRIAIERGEINGDCGGWTSLPEAWVRDAKINVIVRLSQTPARGLDMSYPFARNLIKDQRDRQTYDFLMAPEQLGRLFLVSGKVAVARVAMLRAAFTAMLADPAFVNEAAKLNLLITPMSGEEVARRIAELYATSADIVARARLLTGD